MRVMERSSSAKHRDRVSRRDSMHDNTMQEPLLPGQRFASPPYARIPAAMASRISPMDRRPSHSHAPTLNKLPALLPNKQLQQTRIREKFVPLPEEDLPGDEEPSPADVHVESKFRDIQEPPPAVVGRIKSTCIAESFDRKKLEVLLRSHFPQCTIQPLQDVLCSCHPKAEEHLTGDIFFFDYGVVVMWGLTQQQENDVISTVARPAQVQPYDAAELEVDEMKYMCSASERPNISNDTITLSRRAAKDQAIKIAISHALAQSTKLCIYEERVSELVEDTRDMPETLATEGRVRISRKKIAQLIGKVFIQQSAVNLLSTVLDTPEYFWSAPDSLQALYKRVCEYLELDTRVQVLNNRYTVINEMLNVVRDHENNAHTARLEWIVIWLIVVEVVVGLFECASILGWVGHQHEH